MTRRPDVPLCDTRARSADALAHPQGDSHTVQMEITTNTGTWQPSTDPHVHGSTASQSRAVVTIERRPVPAPRANTRPTTASSAR